MEKQEDEQRNDDHPFIRISDNYRVADSDDAIDRACQSKEYSEAAGKTELEGTGRILANYKVVSYVTECDCCHNVRGCLQQQLKSFDISICVACMYDSVLKCRILEMRLQKLIEEFTEYKKSRWL